jgi:hypothetical protein
VGGAPLLGAQGAQDEVGPAPATPDRPRRVALAPEPGPAQERERGPVVGLDPGLEAVELVAAERLAQREVEALAHEPLPGAPGEGVVPDAGLVHRAGHHLAQVDHPDERAAVAQTHQVELVAQARTQEKARERAGRDRRADPAPVQRAARPGRGDELGLVLGARPPQEDPRPDLERADGARLHGRAGDLAGAAHLTGRSPG